MAENLGTIGEDGLIELLTGNLGSNPQLLVGPGDDCAVIDLGDPENHGLLKTDCVIEGVHFLPDADPEKVGWKAAARVVSDFAAMGGGQPEQALITLIAPADRNVDWARGIYVGLTRCAEKFGFAIAGGETSTSEVAVISVSMFGRIAPDQIRLRSAAKLGDTIYVTGELGGAVESGKHLDFEPRLDLARKLNPVHAMMDLSDGLAKDLPRLATASNLGFQLEPGLSQAALTDGEDYELLFTSPDPNLDFPRIGTIVAADESDRLEGGWDPFRK